MPYHVAQINIAKMRAPIDSPVMAEFVANLDAINAVAEKSDGFVWRLKEENNNATAIKIYDDDFLIVNMSVWENTDVLFRYVYQSGHTAMFKNKKQWFEKMTDRHMALWYIPQATIPTVADAVARLDYLRKNGESPFSFTFKKKYTIEEMMDFKMK